MSRLTGRRRRPRAANWPTLLAALSSNWRRARFQLRAWPEALAAGATSGRSAPATQHFVGPAARIQ